MPLDPQMKVVLDAMAGAKTPPFHKMTPQEARTLMSRRAAQGEPEPVARVEDRSISGPAGDIPVRVYTPAGSGPFGVCVYFHGGGWVLGDIEMTDQPCRLLTKAAGCVTISVDYRLAPEHKFPAGPEDCYAVVNWIATNGPAVNVDARRTRTNPSLRSSRKSIPRPTGRRVRSRSR